MNELIRRKSRIHLSFPEKIKKNVLVVAPHPDDELLGCGGIMKQLARENHCYKVLLLTAKGEQYQTRLEEFKKAMQSIGCSQYEILHCQDGALKEQRIELTDCIHNICILEDYSSIFVPYVLDSNFDHIYTNFVIAQVLKEIRKDISVFMYEVWTPILYPDYYIDISKEFKEKEIGISAYESQNHIFYVSRRVKAMNQMRAALLGKEKYQYVEAFRGFTEEEYIEIIDKVIEQEVDR